MRCSCRPSFQDLGSVVPNLSVSVRQILETNVVPNASAPAEYNGFEDFSQFGGHVRDSFDAFEYQQRLSRVQSIRAKANASGGETEPGQSAE